VEVLNGATVADRRALHTTRSRLAVDAFARSALARDRSIQRASTIQEHAHASASVGVEIRDTARALDTRVLVARLASAVRVHERTTGAVSRRAVGRSKGGGGSPAHACGTHGHAIRVEDGRGRGREGNGSTAVMAKAHVVHVPCIRGSISRDLGRKGWHGRNGLPGHRANRGHVAFMAWQGVLCQHDIAIVGSDGSSDSRSVASERRLFLCDRAVGLDRVGAPCDANPALRIACGLAVVVKAIEQGDAGMVFCDPRGEVRDIEGDDLTQSRDVLREGRNRGWEQIAHAFVSTVVVLLAEPAVARNGARDSETRGVGGIPHRHQASCTHEEGMFEEQAAHLGQRDVVFAARDKQGLDGGGFGMRKRARPGAMRMTLRDKAPIEQGTQRARALNHRVNALHESPLGRVKGCSTCSHAPGLLR